MSHYSFSAIRGNTLRALDGDLGSVRDIFFEDSGWEIRYLVADTGNWLPGRIVLLSPTALQTPDWKSGTLPVALTQEQIKNSPDINTEKPVSLQMQEELSAYYGWPFLPTYPYWPVGGYPTPSLPDTANPFPTPEPPAKGPQLRSCREIVGYTIAARDGEIGKVKDFIIDTENWKIPLVAVDTGSWLPGKKVLISPVKVPEISWSAGSISVDLTRDQVKGAPEYDPKNRVNVEYERKVLDYYGRPR